MPGWRSPTPTGAARTWGAYQHYGDPFFRLLDPEALIKARLGKSNTLPTRVGPVRTTTASEPDAAGTARVVAEVVVVAQESVISTIRSEKGQFEPQDAVAKTSAIGAASPAATINAMVSELGQTAASGSEQPRSASASSPRSEVRKESSGRRSQRLPKD